MRHAYVGQDLYQSGLKFGSRIVELVPAGDVFLFIATPGQLNIQPRVDGALDAVRDSGKAIHVHVVVTGADVIGERKKVEATYRAHPRLRGMFAVDGGSTQAVADVMRRHALHRKGVRAEATTCCPVRSNRSPRAASISPSTSSLTSRACCRSSSCSCTATAGASCPRPTRTRG